MHRLHRPRSALVPIAAALVLAGCGSGGPDEAENRPARTEKGAAAQPPTQRGTSKRRPSRRAHAETTRSPRGPYEPGVLRKIVAGLERKVGYSPTVREIMLGDNFVWFDVIERANPQKVDSFRWVGGRFEKTQPTRLTEADQQGLSEAPFTLDEIDLDAAAELKRKGDSVDIEDPETATMIIKRDEPFHHRILWRVSISGPHDSRVLVANAEGRVIDTQ